MLGDKQQQITESGSTALQAGRDIIFHNGLSLTEVHETCIFLLKENFPKLQEAAKRTAEEYVLKFARDLEARLAKDAASIVIEKFKDPDVQAALNDAVQATARKGLAASPNILAALISRRVSKKTDEFLGLVLSEAVCVVPRLTGRHIALLSFVFFVQRIFITKLHSVAALEQIGKDALDYFGSGFSLSEPQIQHLQYAGAASVNNICGGNIFNTQNDGYKYFGINGPASFKAALSADAPTYLQLLEQYDADNLFAVRLTSVGQAIALANISNLMGDLDYTAWLG